MLLSISAKTSTVRTIAEEINVAVYSQSGLPPLYCDRTVFSPNEAHTWLDTVNQACTYYLFMYLHGLLELLLDNHSQKYRPLSFASYKGFRKSSNHRGELSSCFHSVVSSEKQPGFGLSTFIFTLCDIKSISCHCTFFPISNNKVTLCLSL